MPGKNKLESQLARLKKISMDEDSFGRFESELLKSNISERSFEKIILALEYVSPQGFVYALQSRDPYFEIKEPVKRRALINKFLKDLELAKPVVEKISTKARKKGLVSRLERHPLFSLYPFPTLVFRDSKGPVFWACFRPEGKKIVIESLQGLNSQKDRQTLGRIQRAVKRMGYDRLRDGLFNEISNAAKGTFKEVIIMDPITDIHYRGDKGTYHALVRRLKLKKEPVRARRRI